MLDVLTSFPRSRFLLVGDSGEQDLELYAQLAAERPRQILGVFVRDVHQGGVVPVPDLKDPTGRVGGALPGVGPGGIGMGAPGAPSQPLQPGEQPPPPPQSLGGRKRASEMVRRVSGHAAAAASSVRHRNSSGSDALSITTSVPRQAQQQSAQPRTSSDSLSTPTSYAPYRSARSRAPSASSGSSISVSLQGPPPAAAIPDDYFTGRRSPAASTFGFASSYTGSPLAEEPEQCATPPVSQPPQQQRNVSEPERKRDELQARVYRARIVMPDHVPLRVFRHPKECVEAEEILDRLNIGRKR